MTVLSLIRDRGVPLRLVFAMAVVRGSGMMRHDGGAIVSALAGALAGESAIPPEWLALVDFPRSLRWIRQLGARLAQRSGPVPLWWPAVPVRNALFAAIALATGLRRLLPSY